jgi:very-short-patch-repair endonuclease
MFICTKCRKTDFKSDLGRKLHEKHCKNVKEICEQIRLLYAQGFSCSEIIKKGFLVSVVMFALKGKTRTTSEALKNFNKLHMRYKCSEATKKKISDSMKLSKNKGWKKFSYAEEFFNKFLINNDFKIYDDYFREFHISIYRIDFFFPKLRIAIEIDGQQHYKYKNRQISDKKKDALLTSLGYKVIRISFKFLFTNTKLILNDVLDILKNTKEQDLLIKNFSDSQLKCLRMFDEIKKRKQLKKIEKINKKQTQLQTQLQTYLKDAQQVLGMDDISPILSLKWNRTRQFVKRFFNKHFPDECITIKTCKCGKKIKTKSAFIVHKLFCEQVNNIELKNKVLYDYNVLYLSSDEISKKHNVVFGVVDEILKETKRKSGESQKLRHLFDKTHKPIAQLDNAQIS